MPVVDMRLKFGLPKAELTNDSRIIIMEVNTDEDAAVVGALVDAVQSVIMLEADQIETPPKIGTRLKTEFIKGIGKHKGSFIIVLDIDRALGDELAIEREAAQDE